MLYVHHVHTAVPGRWDELAAAVRGDLLPAVADVDGARVVWCARPLATAVSAGELITLTAVADADALGRLATGFASGPLAAAADRVAAARRRVQTRLLKPLAYNPLAVDNVASVPIEREAGGACPAYMHDLVPPRIGARRLYEEGMRKMYAAMTRDDLASIVLWASLEPAPGGGPFPEQLNISKINDTSTAIGLLEHDVAKDNPAVTAWMRQALAMRDTWVTRLVRALPWSPLV